MPRLLQDEYGNETATASDEHSPACLEILGPAGTASQNVVVPDLRVAANQVCLYPPMRCSLIKLPSDTQEVYSVAEASG
jgi:hypothetical protein